MAAHGKLTTEQIAEIQRHPSAPITAKARKYGVSRTTIQWHLRNLPGIRANGRPHKEPPMAAPPRIRTMLLSLKYIPKGQSVPRREALGSTCELCGAPAAVVPPGHLCLCPACK